MNQTTERLVDRVLGARFAPHAALIAVSAAMGWFVSRVSAMMAESVTKQLLLPIAMACALWFAMSPSTVFFAVMLLRSAIDKPLENIKFGNSGVGSLFNAAIILLLLYFVFLKPKRFFTFVLPLWAPFLAMVVFALFMAPDTVTAIKTFYVVASCMAVFTIPLCMEKPKLNLISASKLVLFSSIFPALYGIWDASQGGLQDGRVASTFLHENIFAFFLSLNIALAVLLLVHPSKPLSARMRIVLTAYTLLLLGLLGGAGTRSAWAGCAFFFIAYGVFLNRRFLVLLLIGGAFLFFLPPVQHRLQDLFEHSSYVSSLSQLNSFEWRLNQWRLGLKYLKPDDYLLGKGLESFFYYSLTFNPLNYNQNGAHSVYVQTFFEMGIVGILTAAWLFYKIIRTIALRYRRHRVETVIVLAILAMFLFFCFGDNLYGYLVFNWYFALIMGTACSMSLAEKAADDAAATHAAETVVVARPVQPPGPRGARRPSAVGR